jgi:hypothetical protein
LTFGLSSTITSTLPSFVTLTGFSITFPYLIWFADIPMMRDSAGID